MGEGDAMFKYFLYGILAFSVGLIIAIAAVNWKLEGKKAEVWTKRLQALLLLGDLGLLYLWSVLSKNAEEAALNINWGGVWLFAVGLVSAFFLSVEYVRYLKKKDDPEAAQKMIKTAGVWVFCILALSVLGLIHLIVG